MYSSNYWSSTENNNTNAWNFNFNNGYANNNNKTNNNYVRCVRRWNRARPASFGKVAPWS
ncbi:MAG: DUF1566 domain-containing protein [Bdellovibrionales bacterium]|nr:DUF1566 domain-containing protein [Bdellovibrionales bacterium]